jgi:hypothetical protein
MAQTVIMEVKVDLEAVMVTIHVVSVLNLHLVEMAAAEDKVP